MDTQLPHLYIAPLAGPLAVPVGTRVYRRPSPPPSAKNGPKSNTPVRLPVRPPQPLTAQPPITQLSNALPSPIQRPPGLFHRLGWLVLPTLAVGIVLALGAMWLFSRSGHLLATRRCDDIAQRVMANESMSTNLKDGEPDALLASASLSMMFQESFDDFGDSQTAPTNLTGAKLLASRFYELQIDATGRVISARMPARDDTQRFGPSMDEIAALLELPDLERLDLGNTLASAAVPVANRHPHVKVLVLEDQTDAASLRRAKDGLQVVIAGRTE